MSVYEAFYTHVASISRLLCCVFSGFHNRWNGLVGVRHPNNWTFIRKLKDQERQCRHTLHAARRGNPPPKRQRRYRKLDKEIRRL